MTQDKQTKAIENATRSMATPANALIAINMHSEIVFVTNSEEFFGYKADQLIGRDLDIILPFNVNLSHKGWVKKFGKGELSERIMAEGRMVHGRTKDNEAISCYVQIRRILLTEFDHQILVAICTRTDNPKQLLAVSRRTTTTTISDEQGQTVSRVETVVGLAGRVASYIANYPFRSFATFILFCAVMFILTSAFLTFKSGDRLLDIFEKIFFKD